MYFTKIQLTLFLSMVLPLLGYTIVPALAGPQGGDDLCFLPPDPGPCDYNNLEIDGGTVTLLPGKYCGGIKIDGGAQVTLDPGVYYVDGEVSLLGGSSIDGDGVGFYLTGGSAGVDFSGGGQIHLSAPTSGSLAGLIFFQDPTANPGHTSAISGGGDLYYEGTLYFPTQNLSMSGGSTASSTSPYTMWIANKLEADGNSELVIGADISASDVPLPPGLAGPVVALVR